jgi:hypothetical protein
MCENADNTHNRVTCVVQYTPHAFVIQITNRFIKYISIGSWSFTLREEHRLRVLKRILVYMREAVIAGCRYLHDEKLVLSTKYD